MLRFAGMAVMTGFGLMLILITWGIFFAHSSAERGIAIFAAAGIGVIMIICRVIAFAIDIGIWPFVRNVGTIVGLFVALIGVYTFRHDAAWVADRMLRELDPSGPTEEADGTIALALGKDGHYYTRAEVNGVTITFMIDTGATDIVLAPSDAQRVGFDVASLNFSQETETANGIGRAAVISLDDLRIAHLEMRDLPARVNRAHMSDSLLGMEFLRRLHGWRVERGMLLLEP